MNQIYRLLGPGILAIGVVLIAGCNGQQEEDTTESNNNTTRSVVVDAQPAQIQSVNESIELVGSLESKDETLVSSEVSGIVDKIHFKEGEQIQSNLNGNPEHPLLVSLNDDLFQIAVQNAQARLEIARTQLEQARDSFQREQKMYKKDATSEASFTRAKLDFQQAKAEAQRAKAELDRARERLSKTKIRAPIQGMLGERLVSPGSYIRPGDPLVEVTKLHPIEVSFNVPEKFRPQLERGQRVDVELEAFPDRRFEGSVFYISPSTDQETRTVKVKAKMKNSERLLQPGMFARVELILDTRKEAHVVPETAVVPRNKKTYVYVIKNGKAKRQEVKTGQRMPGNVEIRSGLDGKETVITAGLQMVSDGVPVQVREE